MIAFLASFLRLSFLALGSRRNVLSKKALLKKENDILLRRVGNWTFEHRPAKGGRKPVDTDVKNLILCMKNDNLLWGVKRIQVSC